MGHAIGCSSGTDALWLALAGAGIGPGDAVITTCFSFFATVSAILRAGARPLLVDIDPETFNLDPAAARACLESASGPTVRALLPVHLYGQIVDWDCFARLKQEYGLLLIEDAAQAFGASWNGRMAGALGDAAAFSFYPTKNLSAARRRRHGHHAWTMQSPSESACCGSTACASVTSTMKSVGTAAWTHCRPRFCW